MTLEEQIQKLTSERDAAQADLKAIGECVGGDPLAVRGLVESMDAVIKERDAALKACKFYRDTLSCIVGFDEDSPWDDPGHCAKDALSRCDCGKGYVKAESLRCFKCDDGHTPLYCLNCAREGYRHDDEWRPVVEALKEILFVVRNTPSVAAYFVGRKAAESLAHAESLLKK